MGVDASETDEMFSAIKGERRTPERRPDFDYRSKFAGRVYAAVRL